MSVLNPIQTGGYGRDWGLQELASESLSLCNPEFFSVTPADLLVPTTGLGIVSGTAWKSPALTDSRALTEHLIVSDSLASLNEWATPVIWSPEASAHTAASLLVHSGLSTESDRNNRHASRLAPFTNLFFSRDAAQQRLRSENLLNQLHIQLAHWENRMGFAMSDADYSRLMQEDLDVFLSHNAQRSAPMPSEYAALKHRTALISYAIALSYFHNVELYIFDNGTVALPDGTCGIVLETAGGFVFYANENPGRIRYTHSLFADDHTTPSFFRKAFRHTIGSANLYYDGKRYAVATNKNGKIISCYDSNDRHFEIIEKDDHFTFEPSPPFPNGFVNSTGGLCRWMYQNGKFHPSYRQIWDKGKNLGFVFDTLDLVVDIKGNALPIKPDAVKTVQTTINSTKPHPTELTNNIYWPSDAAWEYDGVSWKTYTPPVYRHRGREWEIRDENSGYFMVGSKESNDRTLPENFMLLQKTGDRITPLDVDALKSLITRETLDDKGVPFVYEPQKTKPKFICATLKDELIEPPYPLIIPEHEGVKILRFDMANLDVSDKQGNRYLVRIPSLNRLMTDKSKKYGYYIPDVNDVMKFMEILSQKIPPALLKQIGEINFYPLPGFSSEKNITVQGSYRGNTFGKDALSFFGIRTNSSEEWLKRITGRLLTHEILGHGVEHNRNEVRQLILAAMLLDGATTDYGDTNWREYFAVMTEYVIHEPEMRHRFPWSFRVVNHFLRKAAE